MVWATAGVHPHDATGGIDGLEALLAEPEVVAVGECGLDYFYEHSPRDVQREVFVAQIALAKAHDLALVIHTRDAWADTFDVLAAGGCPERTVFHCFTGGPDEATALPRPRGGAVVQRHRHVPVGAPTCTRPPRCAPSTGCWSRPTARTSPRCRTGASATSRRGSPWSGEAVAALQGVPPETVAAATWATAEHVYRL